MFVLKRIRLITILFAWLILTANQKKQTQTNFTKFEQEILQLIWDVAETEDIDRLLNTVDVSKLTGNQKAKYYYYYAISPQHAMEGEKTLNLLDQALKIPSLTLKTRALLLVAKTEVLMRSFWKPKDALACTIMVDAYLKNHKNEFTDYEILHYRFRKMVVYFATERLEEANSQAEELLDDLEKDKAPKIIYNSFINGVILVNVDIENPYIAFKAKRIYDGLPKANTNSFMLSQTTIHNNLGQTNLIIGNYEEAQREQLEAKKIFDYYNAEYSYEWYWHMAWLNGEIGNYENALFFLGNAKNSIYKNLGETSYDYYLINSLEFYINTINNKPKEAGIILDTMKLLYKKYNYLNGENISLLGDMALQDYKLGKYKQSASLYKEIIDKIQEAKYNSYRQQLLEYHYYYLQSLLQSGKIEQANKEYQKTIKLIDTKYAEQNNQNIFDILLMNGQFIAQDTVKLLAHYNQFLKRTSGFFIYEIIANKELAKIYFKIYQKNKQVHTLELAQYYINAAFEISSNHLSKILSVTDRAKLKSDYKQIQETGLEISYEYFKRTKSEKYLLSFINQPKFDNLKQNLLFKNNESVKNEMNILIETNQIVKNRIDYLNQQLKKSIATDKMFSYQNERNILEKQLLSNESKIKQHSQKYFNVIYQPAITNLNLDKETLISYAYTDSMLYAVVWQDEKREFHKWKVYNLAEKINDINEAIQSENISFSTLSHNLFMEIFQPIEKKIRYSKLIISPSEEMANLNFEYLLPDSNRSEFLLEKYTFNYWFSPDAVQLLKQYKLSKPAKRFIAFSPELFKEYNLTPLHISTQTLLQIAKKFKTQPITGQEATETRFKAEIAKTKTVLLATHGIVNEEQPSESYIALQQDAINDGKLHINEIIETPLQTDFLVLASCEGSKGKLLTGFGNFSLSNAFTYAGIQTVLSSNWKIDEKTTMQILTDFFKYLKQGKSKADALRQAKLDFIKNAQDPKLKNPYYWAALVIVGNDSPEFKKQTTLYWCLGILLVFACGFLGRAVIKQVKK